MGKGFNDYGNVYTDSLGVCIRVHGVWREAVEYDCYFARCSNGDVFALCEDGEWW